MTIDLTTLFAGASMAIALVVAISTFVYLVVRLVTNPLKEDLEELKPKIDKLLSKLRSEDDIDRIIDVKIANHKEMCRGQ